MNKKLVIIILFLLAVFGIGFLFFEKNFADKKNILPVFSPLISENPAKKEPVKIILTGDIVLDRGVEYKIKKEGNGDFKFPFLKIADYLKTADIVFGNLEGPISDKGIKVGSIYSFRMDPKAIEALSFAGFNILSFSNNHVFDYGQKAFEDTLLRLKEAGIDYVGAGMDTEEAHKAAIKEVNGIKIAFLAYTNLGSGNWAAGADYSGIAWIKEYDFERMIQDIEKAKGESDVLIVSVHAGDEYTQKLTEFQKEFAKAAIDSGADLIIGHHPHVVQKSEQYKGKWIFYSLGNFIFDQDFSEETMRGQLVEIIIDNGKIKKVIPRELRMNKFFQPELIQ